MTSLGTPHQIYEWANNLINEHSKLMLDYIFLEPLQIYVLSITVFFDFSKTKYSSPNLLLICVMTKMSVLSFQFYCNQY